MTDDCTGLRASLDASERRIEELESQLGMAERKNEEGRLLFADLYKRCFVDGDDYDRQLADMMAWAGIKQED